MKFHKIAAFIALFFIAYSACSGTPRIAFDTLEHDFGDQKQGLQIKHKFTFSNKGTSTLIIEKVKAG